MIKYKWCNMKKHKKIGYVNINNNILEIIKNIFPNVLFCNIRKSKHKIYDITLYDENTTIEEKTMYEMFNSYLINVSNSTISNIIENINNALDNVRILSDKQISYISVINKFHYINEKIELLMGDKSSHCLKVAYLLKSFCDKTSMSYERTLDLYMAGLFHDIGKYYIDPSILCKKGKLSDSEYEEIKKHPLKSYELLKGYLPEEVLLMIRDHHLREDNSGYPENEEASSEWSEILSLSDSFDAMISKRVYNTPMTRNDGIRELILCSKNESEGGKGIMFNPYLTKLFINTL